MSLPSRSIRRPVAVAMLFVAVVFLGLISFVRLPIDLLPDVAYPRLVIYTSYASVAPQEVERFITERIEQQVSTVPGVQEVSSTTREGISLVTVRFAWGTDMDFAMLNVRERLDNLRDRLPEQADRPVVLRTDPQSEPVMALSVAGDIDLLALKELGESVFKRRLEQIDGVAQAAVTGGLEREIHVEVDPRLLQSFGIAISDIEQALAAANVSAPGGTVLRGRYRYALRTLGEFESVPQIEDVVVGRRGASGAAPGVSGAGVAAGQGGAAAGTGASDGSGAADSASQGAAAASAALLTVRDVARVEDGYRERESIARYNGAEAVGLLLFKESGANTVRVAASVADVLNQLRIEYPAVRVDVAMSQAGFISGAIANVVQALVLGGVLAFLVLFLFLRDARLPIAIGLAIPVSVVGTFALLDATGLSLNIMTLGGLALGVGMLVDNSIVVLENIFRHREKGLAAAAAAAVGTEEVTAAITAATLTTIAVFGPIVYVQGVAGELFGAVSLAVAFSLLASLLVAVTLLPTLAARWQADGPHAAADGAPPRRRLLRALARRITAPVARLLRPPLDAFDRQFTRVAGAYDRMLTAALDHRARVIALGVGLLALAVVVGLALDRSVLPDVDQGAFSVRLELEQGTPLEQTAEAAARLEAGFRTDPAVEAVFARIGRQAAVAGVEDQGSGLNTAVLDVRLRPGQRTDAVLERSRAILAGFPQGAVTVETGQATALGRLLGGGEADLAVRVRSDDLAGALAYAGELEARLADVPALTNVRLGTELGQPEVQLEIDRERAAAYDIEPQAVARTVEAYMNGVQATEFIDFDRKIPVIVRLPDEARRSLETLDLLHVGGIPLREVVRTHEALGPSEVRRVDQSRMVPIYADAATGDLQGAVAAAEAAVAAVPPPRDIRVDVGGENEEMRRSFRDLAFAFAIALLLVYMILAAEFESFLHPFTILLTVPLGVVGAVFALWVAGDRKSVV